MWFGGGFCYCADVADRCAEEVVVVDSREASAAMLVQARESRGLLQAEVAAAMSGHLGEPVSQGYVSKAEAGRLSVTGERLEAFSAVLRYPVDVLCAEPGADAAGIGLIHHRKRASLGGPALRRIHAELMFARRQLAGLEALSDRRPHGFRKRQLTAEDTPAEIAIDVRKEWGLGDKPIGDLVATIEHAGGVVLVRDLGSKELDAVSQWSADGAPLFLLNVNAPADRMRFSLSHELGHVIMHSAPGATAEHERQADEFASSFLMPAEGIRSELRRGVDVECIMRLKTTWGASMASLARRALDLGGLSDWQYRNIMIEMSVLGYRVQEPVAIEPECPSKVSELVEELTRKRGYDLDQLAATAGLMRDEFEQLYLAKPSQ